MGSGMARRLLTRGFALTVYNRDPAKTVSLAAEGAHVAHSPRQAAAGAEVVISMVADDAASRALWLGSDGVLAGAKPGTILIESSTLTVGWVSELAQAAATANCEFIDAPVTGSRPQAAAGELNFLVGGTAATLEKVRPVLLPMSRSITHLGPVGSGALIKLVNNFVCGVQVAALAEAVGVIEHSGLDRVRALEVLTNGAPGSPLVKTIAARMTAPDFTPNFLLRLMAKDLGYACAEGKRHGVTLQTAAAALKLFETSMARRDGDKDMSAVVEQFRA